jgi:hypothetical protein
MNVTHIKNFDSINELPSDENYVSENEMKIVNMLFKEKENFKIKKYDIFEVLIVAVLFVLLSLPCFESLLHSIIIVQNENIYLIIKTILMMSLFFVIKHYGKNLNLF